MEWDNLLNQIKNWLAADDIKLFPPVTDAQMQKAEQMLGVSFPEELLALLKVSNGAEELMKNPKTGELMAIDYLYWSIDEIVSNSLIQYDNLKSIESENKMQYLFFAGDGCGNSFGYKVVNGKCDDSVVNIYHPIDDMDVVVARSLKEWAENWFTGKMST